MISISSRWSQHRRRQLLALALLLLALVGWWWYQHPRTMRLVQTIPIAPGSVLLNISHDPALFGAFGGLFLRIDRRSTNTDVPATISFIGWDGQPRWRVTTTVPDEVWCREYWSSTDNYEPRVFVDLSPDGHAFMMVHRVGKILRIQSWLDGRPLGEARIVWPFPFPYGGFAITNSGQVWMTHTRKDSRCLLWAIDGSHIATGTYRATFLPSNATRGCGYTVSPAGTTLLCNGYEYIEYTTLRVQGEKVLAIRRYSTLNSNRYEGFVWCDGQHALGEDGTLIGPKGLTKEPQYWEMTYSSIDCAPGLIHRDSNSDESRRLRVYRLPPSRPWIIPSGFIIGSCAYLPDGSAVLVSEYGVRRPQWAELVVDKPLIGGLINRLAERQKRTRYAVYTAPGRLRAVLPRYAPYSSMKSALFPDARKAAFLCERENGWVIQIYTW